MFIRISIVMAILFTYSFSISQDMSEEVCERPAFDRFFLKPYEKHLVNLVNSQIAKDEMEIKKGNEIVNINKNIVANGGSPDDLLSVPPEYSQALERKTYRRDDCLDEAIRTQLSNRINNNCSGEKENVQRKCRIATDITRDALDYALSSTKELEKNPTRSDGVASAKKSIELLIEARVKVEEVNELCANAIFNATDIKCLNTFDELFTMNPQMVDLFARTCTTNGVSTQLDLLAEDLNRNGSSARILRYLSDEHIKNRERENEIAEKLEVLADYVSKLNAEKETRSTASEKEENLTE